jgi:hypothetical protein
MVDKKTVQSNDDTLNAPLGKWSSRSRERRPYRGSHQYMVSEKEGYPKSWRHGWLKYSGGHTISDSQLCTLLLDFILDGSGRIEGGMMRHDK